MTLKHLLPLLLAVATLFGALNTYAQRGKIDGGKIYYDSGEYIKAINKVLEGMEDTSNFRPRDFAKAHIVMAQSAFNVYAMAQNKKADEDVRQKYQEFQERNPNLLLDGARSALKVARYDEKQYYTNDLKRVKIQLANALYAKAFDRFQSDKLESALEYMNLCLELTQETPYYGYHMLRAFIHNALGNDEKSLADLEKTMELYKARENQEMTDENMLTVYLQAIRYHKELTQDYDRALLLVDEAKEAYPGNERINKVEIDLYTVPELYDKALVKLEEKVEENPNDPLAHLVYGQLLEKKDIDQAIIQYKKALNLDPDNLTANFNLGALYNNKAKELTDEYNELIISDPEGERTKALEKEINKAFQAALPYMEKAHEMEPENETILNVLVQITANLKMMDKMEQYMEKRKAVRGE